jgi:branched-chain amino acid transport system substrate-binding protein
MRKGMESLSGYNANGLLPPITISAKDHGGGGKTRIELWDGAKWVPQSDWFSDYDELVWTTVREHSAEYSKSARQ